MLTDAGGVSMAVHMLGSMPASWWTVLATKLRCTCAAGVAAGAAAGAAGCYSLATGTGACEGGGEAPT